MGGWVGGWRADWTVVGMERRKKEKEAAPWTVVWRGARTPLPSPPLFLPPPPRAHTGWMIQWWVSCAWARAQKESKRARPWRFRILEGTVAGAAKEGGRSSSSFASPSCTLHPRLRHHAYASSIATQGQAEGTRRRVPLPSFSPTHPRSSIHPQARRTSHGLLKGIMQRRCPLFLAS